MTSLIQFVRLSFPHWLWRRVIRIPNFDKGNTVSRGCLLLRCIWSSSGVSRGPCKPDFHYGLFHVPKMGIDYDYGFSVHLPRLTILTADWSVHLHCIHWIWLPVFDFGNRVHGHVTGQQWMLTPPRHLTLPLHLSEVCVALHSIL
jgi:hypothetical protein